MNNYNLTELLDNLLYKTTAFRKLNESDSELWWYSKDNITHYLLDDMSFRIECELHECRVMAIILDNDTKIYIMDFDENMYLVDDSNQFIVSRVIDDQTTRIIQYLIDNGMIERKEIYLNNKLDYTVYVYDADGCGYKELSYILDDDGIYYGYFDDGGVNVKIPLSVVNMKVTKTVEIDLKAI